MKTVLAKARNLFCYCGLDKEAYRSIKKEAYISNYQVWQYLHVLFLVGYAVLALVLYRYDGVTAATYIQIGMTVYFAVMSVLIVFVFKKDSLIAQFAIYLSMILLLIASLLIAVLMPQSNSVTFIVLLVLLPMFMIDKPYYMAILLAAAVVVYLAAVNQTRGADALRHEALFAIFYGAIGILNNTFYNFIRIREFSMRKREREYIAEEQRANAEAGKLNTALKKMSESALELLGDIVEERDMESGEHIRRVKGFSYILARQVMQDLPEYKLDNYTVDLIALTSVLHDVGKISITDNILCKPGRLTTDEFSVMQTHCERGCFILRKMEDKWSKDYLDMSLTICMSHHEKWDGRGYPQGLKGDEIPIAAQIVSIADIFDALTTKRVYKDAYPYDQAYEMILNGECGAFSDKLLECFKHCYEKFKAHADNLYDLKFGDMDYELVSKSNPGESFVIGLHDSDRNLHEKLRLSEEISVMENLSENFCYICYVNMLTNEVIRFKADDRFTRILDSYGAGLKSYERFDKLLNSIIVAEDYPEFRAATDREKATSLLLEAGHFSTDFRIRLEDGVHYCRMRLSLDPNHANAVIIGISMRDEEHEMEQAYVNIQNELENARREMENREKLADRLAVIDCISSEYDYVCSLNADTMDIVVYRAEAWIRDMFKNLDDLVVSPEARDATLKGIIHPDDFERFQKESQHISVLRALAKNGSYSVNYRAYKYGKLVNYQTRYALDRTSAKRIIIGLRCTGEVDEEATVS